MECIFCKQAQKNGRLSLKQPSVFVKFYHATVNATPTLKYPWSDEASDVDVHMIAVASA